MQFQKSIVESAYFDVTDFNTVSKKLLQIKEGTFGFERYIANNKVVNRIIAPYYLKNELNESDVKSPIFIEKSQENTHFYHILLKNNDLFPIFLSNFNCLFDDLYLENEDDQIVLQLLVKHDTSNWQEEALNQNDCYLSGVENPSKSKFGQFIQTKVISILDRLSNQDSAHDANEFIENKILEKGFICELRVIIQSNNPRPTEEYIQDILNHYTHLNSLMIYEDKEPFNLSNFNLSLNNFHLSESEVISLIHTPIQQNNNPVSTSLILTPKDKIDDTPVSSQKDLQKAFRQVGIFSPNQKLNQSEEQIGNNMQLITIAIPKGKTFTQFVKHTDDISAALGREVNIVKGKDPNTITFLLPLEHRKPVYLNSLISDQSFKQYAKNYHLPLIIGLDMWNKPIYEDLANSPHLLIAGTTNSGKSVFVNSIVATLAQVKKRNELQFYIVDPKQVEFQEYSQHPYVKKVITDMSLAKQLLSQLVETMESRYSQLASANTKNIGEFNQIVSNPMSYIVCIIDEFADLMAQYKESEYFVQRLGQKGRAAGIHLILATQRPDVKTVNGTIKANFPSRISFKLSNNTDYQTVFGTGIPFKNLLGMGDGVMNWVGEQEQFIRFQAPMIADNNNNDNKVQTHLEQLKSIIRNTGETRIKELQREMGIRINDVSDLMKQLVNDGFLYKTNRGYEILEERSSQD